MKILSKTSFLLILAILSIGLALFPKAALAQTDEIQVYDAEIVKPGQFNVMVHSNFTPIGRKEADFPGGIVPNKSVNGAVEWAYGVKDWFEQGLYFPVYTAYSQGRGGSLNGFKVRELFVKPHAAEQKFFYGLNFEFSFNYTYWESQRFTAEMRPIVGTHLGKVDLIVNPIMDTEYKGGVKGLEFVPAGRLAYNLKDDWAVALEEYADMGQFRHFDTIHDQFHELWGVVDHPFHGTDVETGVGVGLTSGADRLTFKLMLGRDLNMREPK